MAWFWLILGGAFEVTPAIVRSQTLDLRRERGPVLVTVRFGDQVLRVIFGEQFVKAREYLKKWQAYRQAKKEGASAEKN